MTNVSVLATHCARGLHEHRPQKRRGSRESRVRAAPAVSRANAYAKETHTSIQVQRKQSGFPCAMALRLISCSPRRPGFVDTVAVRKLAHRRPGWADAPPQDLTPAKGRQDHTTSPYATCVIRLRAGCRSRETRPATTSFAPDTVASTASQPTFVTIAKPPSLGRDGKK